MRMICKMYSQFTGLDEDLLREEIDRDNFLSPQKCVEMGIIDFVLD
jgi:ATP-dependent protease ClpP protease subunit